MPLETSTEHSFPYLIAHNGVLMDVISERARQDTKWGEQNHDDLTWLAILMEEVGELATEINDKEPGEKRYAELTQIAAVAVAWLECMRRRA